MKLYDISQEVFGCTTFPGDPSPERKVLLDIANGDVCNLTEFKMCAHNGTHIDAPKHFYKDGKCVDEMDLNRLVGPCYVCFHDGEVSEEDAKEVIEKAKSESGECWRRLLFGGKTVVTKEAAMVFAKEGIYLIGNESQTVGPEDGPMEVHLILLKEEVVLLEGIRLAGIPEGKYMLNAAPLNLGGADGAPCRAILIRDEE